MSARFSEHAGRSPGIDACWEVHAGPALQTLVTADGAVDVVVRFEAGVPHLDVAVRLGFTDQPHLTRELRALLGTTPAACRKSARRADALVAP